MFSRKFVVVFTVLTVVSAVPVSNDLTIRILHTNDMHARFQETSQSTGTCSKSAARQGKCYGGFARLATLIRHARQEGLQNDVPTFFLNAGDTYQGSRLFLHYHWRVVAKFLNILKPDVASLGNHEFDDGISGLVPFLENITFPVVSANLNLSKVPSLQRATSLKPSVTLNVKGRKIGVIGFLTPDTKTLSGNSMLKDLIIKDEVEAVKKEAKILSSQGCNIIIALGHSGFKTEKEIAREVEEVDLVIGGHTDTFLYNGPQPDIEVPVGLYPTTVIQPGGKKVYVVQAYGYTKYLGDLSIDFNNRGDITRIKGTPILVDSSVPKAEDVEMEIQWMLEALNDSVVATTKVFLDGRVDSCRMNECNLGNLITDAMVAYNSWRYQGESEWTDAPIAIHSSGRIRKSIDSTNDNQVSLNDIIEAIPFPTFVYKVNMTGQTLKTALEHSVYDRINATTRGHGGAFLQVSGLRITYDLSKPPNSRIVSVKVHCGHCPIPVYEDLNETNIYTVIMPHFLYQGGDMFTMFKELPFKNLSATISEVVAEYMNHTSPVITGLENRINILVSGNEPVKL